MLAEHRRGLLPHDGAEGAQQGYPRRPGFRARHCRACSPTSAPCARSRSTFCPTPSSSPPTGGEIRVRVGWTAGGGQYISVKDNGPGIPEDEIPVVLSAFGQGSIAIKSAEQGTGLGLPIVQGLLAMHGGEFELHSKLREGTEAIAIFPLSRVMEELPALPTAAVAASRRSGPRQLPVCIVPNRRTAAAMPELVSAAALTMPAARAAPAPSPWLMPRSSSGARPSCSAAFACARLGRQAGEQAMVERRGIGWHESTAAAAVAAKPSSSTGTFSMRAARMAPAIAANSRPPTRRSTSSGSLEMAR